MRRPTLLFLIISACLIIFAVRSVYTLLTLLVEDGSADAIHSAEIPAPNSPLIEKMPQLIPKIIHQTYVNDSVPEHWREAQRSCIDLHGDYEYKLWTDDKSRVLIATEYPWFLSTFESYPHPIQRADAIRYFVLAHYGGTYIDLDDGCNRRLDPLLAYPAWVRRTKPTGISNDAMGATPRHPFFLLVIESLRSYNRDWALPYITVMGSTGPLFLSVVWQEYKRGRARSSVRGEPAPSIPSSSSSTSLSSLSHTPVTAATGAGRWDGQESGRVHILMADEYNRTPWSFFKWHGGSSWHGSDARLIFWMGRHWILLTIAGFAIAGVLGLGAWWVCTRVWIVGGGGGGDCEWERERGRGRGWKGGASLRTCSHSHSHSHTHTQVRGVGTGGWVRWWYDRLPLWRRIGGNGSGSGSGGGGGGGGGSNGSGGDVVKIKGVYALDERLEV